MRPSLTLVLLAALAVPAAAAPRPGVRLTALEVSRAEVNPNLLPNPGFEEVGANGIPTGWMWDRRNTDATCAVDETVKHSGRRSLRLTNGTPFGAHVYGTLWMGAPVALQAGRTYTLSAYVRGEDPGLAWIGGGTGWQFRLRFPPSAGKWQRVSMTFTPGDAETAFVPRICTESPNNLLWIDDVKLEEGGVPTSAASVTGGFVIEAGEQERAVDGDGPFAVDFALSLQEPWNDRVVEVTLDRPRQTLREKLTLAPGCYRLRVSGEAAAADDEPRRLSVHLLSPPISMGTRVAMGGAATDLRCYSAANGLARAQALRKRVAALRSLLDQVRRTGQDPSYPQATFTVLENFAGYAEEDLRRKEVRRGLGQLADLEAMAGRLESELREVLAGRRRLPPVPRWTGDARPRIEGPSFIGPAALPGASPAPRPIFFVGYGHFTQVRADVEKFPRYGTNILQVEFGPSSVFPREGETSDAPVRATLALLDRCRRAGVAVNLLISPHYFPQWMLEKHPEMRRRREGFLQYCLHHPEGQALLKRFVAAAIAPMKDHPALHSICLSNEPVNSEEPCEFAARDWRAWLAKRHGDVATLNARWGTQHASFEAVPYPGQLALGQAPGPARLDLVRFNQEWFAGWHRMLADAVHAAAPDVPVHAKGMTWTFLNDGDVRFGADAELFGGFSEINGNDSVNNYGPQPGGFAQSWGLNAMAFDLQRSVKDAPVFNSENHVIPDRSTSAVPPEHLRSALWQSAVHGQSATTIWVWERTFDPRSDFAGSIMHRPLCAEAVGRTCLDLNRLAPEVTALQRLRPQAAILHAVSARVWDGGRASDCASKLYTALSFTGLKLGFVTERQLERGELPQAPLLFVPNVAHLSDAAFAALKRYTGRVVLVGGDDLLTRGEYDAPRAEKLTGERLDFVYGKTTWRDLWAALLPKLPGLGVSPAVRLTGAQGKPEWGVHWLAAPTPAGPVVTLCNYRSEPVAVRLERAGTDLLTGEKMEGAVTLKPLEVRLVNLR